MKKIIIILTFFSVLIGCQKPLPPETADISLVLLSEENSITQGVAFQETSGEVYYGVSGGQIKKVAPDGKVEEVAEIPGAATYWANRPGTIFITDMQFGPDGLLYIAAKKQVLTLDTETGELQVLLDDLFSGAWGAYALDFTEDGSLIVGDHFGGVKFFDRENEWAQTTLVKPEDTNGPLATFSGVEFSDDQRTLYALDQANSQLFTCSLRWKGGVPEVKSLETVDLGLNYPEFMKYWNGDLFIQAASENKMLRLRDGEIIQTLTVHGVNGAAPGSLVTFCFGTAEDGTIDFYATSFYSVEGVYQGEISY